MLADNNDFGLGLILILPLLFYQDLTSRYVGEAPISKGRASLVSQY
jgi:hypothetical protein